MRLHKVMVGLGVVLGLLGPKPGFTASTEERETKLPQIRLERGPFVNACGAAAEESSELQASAAVECVRTWLELRDLSGTHRVQFLYYDPTGSLYGATKEDWKVQPQKRKGYHKSATVAHRLTISGEQASIHVGTWRVAVVLDDITIGETSFRLDRKPVPQSEGLLEARGLYLELQYEKAAERLGALLAEAADPAVRAEVAWWLALSQNALGRPVEARKTLEGLLKADPMYGVSPEQAKEVGGEELAAALEELRSQRYPDVYRKTTAPPELELSKSGIAPILKRRRPLWKKLVYYVGIPVAVLTVGGLIAGRVVEDRIGNPPVLALRVDAAKAEAMPGYGALCEGRVPMSLTLSGGYPPYDVVILAAQVGGTQPAQLDGGRPLSAGFGDVVVKQRLTGSTELELANIDVSGTPPGAAHLKLIAVARDDRTPQSFDRVFVGQSPPQDLVNALEVADPLDRLVRQELFLVLISDCTQVQGRGVR